MKAIPVAVRERVFKLHDQGTVEIAASFGDRVAAGRPGMPANRTRPPAPLSPP